MPLYAVGCRAGLRVLVSFALDAVVDESLRVGGDVFEVSRVNPP
jgi:hypothetical protein